MIGSCTGFTKWWSKPDRIEPVSSDGADWADTATSSGAGTDLDSEFLLLPRDRLADFILRDMEIILGQWETFAATLLPAAANMKSLALRDHAQQILEAVAADLSAAQTREAQCEKPLARAKTDRSPGDSGADAWSFTRSKRVRIHQLAAEYRALRASVLR
jgi:hypothetical protein